MLEDVGGLQEHDRVNDAYRRQIVSHLHACFP